MEQAGPADLGVRVPCLEVVVDTDQVRQEDGFGMRDVPRSRRNRVIALYCGSVLLGMVGLAAVWVKMLFYGLKSTSIILPRN
jgi:hypothetical protein